jgi:uncharacterized protein (TIGR04222 family)
MTGLEGALPQVSGPAFLIIYLLVGTTITFLTWFWVRADGTQGQPLPRPMADDPLAISYLCGGLRACKRTMVFSLFEHQMLKIQSQNPQNQWDIALKTEGEIRKDQSPAEVRTFNYFLTERRLKDYFYDKELDERLKEDLQTMVRKLESLRFLRTDRDRKAVWVKMAIVIITILAIGSMRTYFGIVNEMPVLGAVILMFIFFTMIILATRGNNATTLGRRYLKETMDQFRWAQESSKSGNIPENVSVSMMVALFGVAIIPSYSSYALLGEAFHQKSAGCGYAVVGGCGGGGCGGCGGGGCGGGGCGGGGCGGGGCGGGG